MRVLFPVPVLSAVLIVGFSAPATAGIVLHIRDRTPDGDQWVSGDGRGWAVSTSSAGAAIGGGTPKDPESFPDVWVATEKIVFFVEITQWHAFAVRDETGEIVIGPKEGGQVCHSDAGTQARVPSADGAFCLSTHGNRCVQSRVYG